jgi:hypothetical protein
MVLVFSMVNTAFLSGGFRKPILLWLTGKDK